MNGAPRIDVALQAFAQLAPGQQMMADALHKITGWERPIARVTLGNMKASAYVTGESVEGKRHAVFTLTPHGEHRLAALTPEAAQPVSRNLERRAFDMVIAHANGCDSEQLAEKLGSTPEVIDQLLALHVEQHRLVTCGVWRGGVTFLQYRASAGSTLAYDWSSQRLAAPASAQKMQRITPPAPAPEPSLRQQIAAKEKAEKGTVAATVSKPTPKRTPSSLAPLSPEPVTNKEPITFPSPSGSWGKIVDTVPVISEDRPFQDFLCYVDSDGDTYIYSNGEEFGLPPEHTRKLMKYFALINAASMVMEPAGAPA